MTQKYIVEHKYKINYFSYYETYNIEAESFEKAQETFKALAKELYAKYKSKSFELKLIKVEEVGLITSQDVYNEIQEERRKEQDKKDYEYYLSLKKRFEPSASV